VAREFGPGPTEAVRAFLAENDDFEIDWEREKFYLTFNPGGYLRRRGLRVDERGTSER
jgi:cephalosporin hydroxylase